MPLPLKAERHCEEDGGGERDVGRRVEEVRVHQVVQYRVHLECTRESVKVDVILANRPTVFNLRNFLFQ